MYIIIFAIIAIFLYSNIEKFTDNPSHMPQGNQTSRNPTQSGSRNTNSNPGNRQNSNTSNNPMHTYPPVIKETSKNKEEFQLITFDKSKFDKLDPFLFKKNNKFVAGFKSNYVRDTFPETVVPNEKGILEFRQSNLVPFLLEGIKDLNQKNIDLTSNIAKTAQIIGPVKAKSDMLKECLKKIVTPEQCKSLFEEYE